LFDITIPFYVEVPGISGSALRIVYFFSVVARGGQVGEFGTMENDQVQRLDSPGFQARHIGKIILNDYRLVHRARTLSGVTRGAGAYRIAVLKMNEAVGS
jgi:hypothetical protein